MYVKIEFCQGLALKLLYYQIESLQSSTIYNFVCILLFNKNKELKVLKDNIACTNIQTHSRLSFRRVKNEPRN